MDPLSIATLASVTGSLIKGGVGIAQKIKAAKLAKKKRPKYTVPESVETALSSSEQALTSTRLPGQGVIEEEIESATAAGVEQAKEASGSSAGLLQTVANLYGGEQRRKAGLGVAAAEKTERDRLNFEKMLMTKGRFEDKAFQINKLDPFYEAKAAESALRQSSTENVFSAATDILGTGAAFLGEQDAKKATPAGDSTSVLSPGVEGAIEAGKGPIAPTSVATADILAPVEAPQEESLFGELEFYQSLYPNATTEQLMDRMAEKSMFRP